MSGYFCIVRIVRVFFSGYCDNLSKDQNQKEALCPSKDVAHIQSTHPHTPTHMKHTHLLLKIHLRALFKMMLGVRAVLWCLTMGPTREELLLWEYAD